MYVCRYIHMYVPSIVRPSFLIPLGVFLSTSILISWRACAGNGESKHLIYRKLSATLAVKVES